MSKVERIELYHVDVPLDEPFWPSWIPGYPQTHCRFTLLRVYAQDGRQGLTAGTAFGRERQGLGSLLGAYLVGLPVDDLGAVRQRLREASYLGWRNWWIEPAFWDLLGKGVDKPVYRLLQETDELVPTVRVYASSGERRDAAARRGYLDLIRRMGFQAVKIRVRDPAQRDDIPTLREIRRELGPDFILGVDANQGWPVSIIQPSPIWDLEYATQVGRACDELGVGWLEEPLDMHDWDGMRELRRRIKTPIAGAEILGDVHEVRAVIERGCLDKVQSDPTFCAGLAGAKEIMALCRTHGLSYTPHTWSNGIGLLIALHAFAAWPDHRTGLLEYPFEPPGWTPEKREGVIRPLTVNPDGTLTVPQDPGLGIELDEKLLRRYGKCFHVSTPLRVAVSTVLEKGLKATPSDQEEQGV
jgi:D-galactarolactone cycloisomerase